MIKLIVLIYLILNIPLKAEDRIRGHYDIIGKVPPKNSLDKVVFEEFLNFGCSYCNKLYKASTNFRKSNEKFVDFIDIPIAFRGQDDAPNRLYYVASKLGKGNLVKKEFFNLRFSNGVNPFDQKIVNYLARSLGIHDEYQKEKNSIWVNNLIKKANIKAKNYRITGTPTIIIEESLKMNHSKYGTMDEFVRSLDSTINDLIKN